MEAAARSVREWKPSVGSPRRALALALAIGALGGIGGAGCDNFSPAGAAPGMTERAEKARADARPTLTATMKAAEKVASTCVAADLHWEADVSGTVIPHHFSRPCIPEHCSPAPADLDALRASVKASKSLVEGDSNLRIPSFQGFVALADAMIGFADTALAGAAKAAPGQANPLVLSGLSMHYADLASAFREIYADADVPAEPPALVASLAVPQPGGDPCKGWALPEYCDVKGVRLPKERKWRTDPACIEVESIMK